MDRHLFLFGGNPPFTENLGRRFADLSLKEDGKIGILFLERVGWQEYMPKYPRVLERNGIQKFVYLPLSANSGVTTASKLKSCTGIIVCGGETERYRKYIVETEVGEQIEEMYENGVPFAGFSAGTLITPEQCVISPHDNSQKTPLFLPGLGLMADCVVSVHYSKWNEAVHLKKAIRETEVSLGYGIDDDAGLYFQNGVLTDSEGSYYTFEF